ncbi:MAG: hypothetical protein MHM6MM_006484 [Cercozoa sp. M6MM]
MAQRETRRADVVQPAKLIMSVQVRCASVVAAVTQLASDLDAELVPAARNTMEHLKLLQEQSKRSRQTIEETVELATQFVATLQRLRDNLRNIDAFNDQLSEIEDTLLLVERTLGISE